MIYRTHYTQERKLLSLPETGMGYQIVKDIQQTNRTFIIFNAEKCFDITTELYGNVQKEHYFYESRMFSEQTPILNVAPSNIIVLQNSFKNDVRTEFYGNNPRSKGAVDNPKEYADGKEIFVRLSHYENDKRVDFHNRKLLPGTYTTTFDDYRFCVDKYQNPVARYALPDDAAIRWAFFIQPKNTDILQRGIVQPAFKHEGGGVEAYFQYGTSKNTYHEKRNYGE